MTLEYISPRPAYELNQTRTTIVYACPERKAKNNKARTIAMVEGVRIVENSIHVNEYNMKQLHILFTQTLAMQVNSTNEDE